MKISKAELEKVAVLEKQYPLSNLPEFAFAGRSNVGKSSFINAMLNRKCKQAGIAKHRFHDLRHGHATFLLKNNVHPKIVQERLGHADISMTLDTYSHLIPDMQAPAVNVINNLIIS